MIFFLIVFGYVMYCLVKFLGTPIIYVYHFILFLISTILVLQWLVWLKLLEQQKTQLRLIILAKHLKPILCRAIKGT